MDKNVIVRTDEVFTKEILQTALKAIEMIFTCSQFTTTGIN